LNIFTIQFLNFEFTAT